MHTFNSSIHFMFKCSALTDEYVSSAIQIHFEHKLAAEGITRHEHKLMTTNKQLNGTFIATRPKHMTTKNAEYQFNGTRRTT
jgi:hypothetical protein